MTVNTEHLNPLLDDLDQAGIRAAIAHGAYECLTGGMDTVTIPWRHLKASLDDVAPLIGQLRTARTVLAGMSAEVDGLRQSAAAVIAEMDRLKRELAARGLTDVAEGRAGVRRPEEGYPSPKGQ